MAILSLPNPAKAEYNIKCPHCWKVSVLSGMELHIRYGNELQVGRKVKLPCGCTIDPGKDYDREKQKAATSRS